MEDIKHLLPSSGRKLRHAKKEINIGLRGPEHEGQGTNLYSTSGRVRAENGKGTGTAEYGSDPPFRLYIFYLYFTCK